MLFFEKMVFRACKRKGFLTKYVIFRTYYNDLDKYSKYK